MTTFSKTDFKKSTGGILNHDGSIRVERHFDVMQTIVYIKGNEIHLRNKSGKKYQAHKHYKLDLTFAEVGDTAFVKFNCGKPYVVGFKKEMRK